MFTEEGRWLGATRKQIEQLLSKLELDEMEQVLDFIETLNYKK